MRRMAYMYLGTPRLAVLGLLVLVACAMLSRVWAQDDDVSRTTLRGVMAARLITSVEATDLSEAWPTPKQVRAEIEEQLHHAGIVTDTEARDLLVVQVWIDQPKTMANLVYYTIAVEFFRAAVSEFRKAAVVPQWSVSEVDVVSRGTLLKVRNRLVNLLDRFIKAYVEQNPAR